MTRFDRGAWYALHVRSRYEKVVTGQLEGKGIDSFLPVYRTLRKWSDRSKEMDLPLFPGYVFASFEAERHLDVLKCVGVVDVVSFGAQPAAVDPAELRYVETIIRSGLLAQPCPVLNVGEKVIVEEGPLKSLEGRVVELKDSLRMVVSVSLLQRAVSVEIERAWVKPARRTFLPACYDLTAALAHTEAA